MSKPDLVCSTPIIHFNFWTFVLFLLTFPFSVTISQSFAVLTIVSFFWAGYFDRKKRNFFKKPIFLAAIMIYLSMIPAILINFASYNDLNAIKKLFVGSEFSDIWMVFIIPAATYQYQQHPRKIEKYLIISLFFICLTGMVSLFTSFRLASYVSSGFQVTPGQRLQHFAGRFGDILLYLPIGFMNTHLTYGGILALLFPGIIVNFILRKQGRLRLSIYYRLIIYLCMVSGGLLLFYNQSRSIWIGLFFTACLYIWKYRRNILYNISYRRLIIIIIGFSILISSSGYIIIKRNWLLQRVIAETFKKRTTENQRYFIYKNTFSILTNHPIFGVGPANFSKQHKESSDEMIRKYEYLWYELEITPRGHAHNDILHFYAIGGLPTLFSFLFFWLVIFHRFFSKKFVSNQLIGVGIISFSIAGFFQCYFLDDEILLPFFSLLAICASRERIQKIASVQPMYGYIIAIILYMAIILLRNINDPEDVYSKKIWSQKPLLREKVFSSLYGTDQKITTNGRELENGFGIEGCLTHRFSQPPYLPRKKKYQLSIIVNEINYPQKVRIELWRRDAFDQDKLYRAHQKQKWQEYHYSLKPGRNIFSFDNITDVVSQHFPENIYFVDFYIFFSEFPQDTQSFFLPIISTGKLCD